MKVNFSLPIVFLREGNRIVAYSPAIDISTSGKTFEEAKKRFTEAASLFFEEIINKKTINLILRDHGWRKTQNCWRAPVVIAQEREELAISL